MSATDKSPALCAMNVTAVSGCSYPEPYKSRMGERSKRKLSEAFSLSQFGVNLVTLGPGGQSALRHWHSHEDEFIYVLEGELVLVTNAGEHLLFASDCAGYQAGCADAHHLLNRSAAPARYLEIGSRISDDQAFYPDDDLIWINCETDHAAGSQPLQPFAAHKNGEPY